jgi:hypothetical protein
MIGAADAKAGNARGHGVSCPLPNAASFAAIQTAARTALGDLLAWGQDTRRDSAIYAALRGVRASVPARAFPQAYGR